MRARARICPQNIYFVIQGKFNNFYLDFVDWDFYLEREQEVFLFSCDFPLYGRRLKEEMGIGFDHIFSKSWNRGRLRVEQYTRLRILSKVADIISCTCTLQEFDERQMFVRQKINSRWEKRLKTVRYYVFMAFLRKQNFRMKIVVKEIEGGQPYFWSVYPAWKVVKNVNGNNKKIFYSGNLEED